MQDTKKPVPRVVDEHGKITPLSPEEDRERIARGLSGYPDDSMWSQVRVDLERDIHQENRFIARFRRIGMMQERKPNGPPPEVKEPIWAEVVIERDGPELRAVGCQLMEGRPIDIDEQHYERRAIEIFKEELDTGTIDLRRKGPTLSREEIRERNARALLGLKEIDEIGDAEEQRETLEALLEGLERHRSLLREPDL